MLHRFYRFCSLFCCLDGNDQDGASRNLSSCASLKSRLTGSAASSTLSSFWLATASSSAGESGGAGGQRGGAGACGSCMHGARSIAACGGRDAGGKSASVSSWFDVGD